MIQIIVNAFVEEGKEIAVVEVLFASVDHEEVKVSIRNQRFNIQTIIWLSMICHWIQI